MMNPVLIDILKLLLWIAAFVCGATFAYLFIFQGHTPVGDRVGGVGVFSGVAAYVLTYMKD